MLRVLGLFVILSLGAVGYAEERIRVFFDHDGGVDDFVSLYMLLASQNVVDIVGVYVTPGDTIMRYAIPATRALVGRFNRSILIGAPAPPPDVTNAAYDEESSPNAFPEDFRLDGQRLWVGSSLPKISEENYAPLDVNPNFVAAHLSLQQAPVVYIVVGPLTSLARALKMNPSLHEKISRVVWMGGAVDVEGNVDQSPAAEWNVYADPLAAIEVWQLPKSIPIWMMPLDATNDVPLTKTFLFRLDFACRNSFISQAYHATAQKTQYYFWDVATVAWVLRPALVTDSRVIKCRVDGETGETRRDPIHGRDVTVAMRLDAPQLYTWLEDLCGVDEQETNNREEL